MGVGALRLLLALSVVIEHSSGNTGFNFATGMVAVQTFFMISGFYMAMILSEKYHSHWSFFSNRLLRIYPMYFTVVVYTVLLGLTTYAVKGNWSTLQFYATHVHELHPISMLSLITTNLFIFGQDVVMFLKIDPQTGLLQFTRNFWITNPPAWRFLVIPQAWSLSLELVFYTMAPFLVRRRNFTLIVIALASLGIRLALAQIGLITDPWSYRFFPSELLFFVAGILAYRIYRSQKMQKKSKLGWRIKVCAIVVLAATILFHSSTILGPHREWLYYVLVWTLFPSVFSYSKENALDRWLGELSYPMYVCHGLIVSFLNLHILRQYLNNTFFFVLATIVLSIIFSVALLRYIQQPIEVYRKQHVR
jgi:peptidoglycan/LPS O-acetylase OafA/YrhL